MDALEEATKEKLLSSVVCGHWWEVITVYEKHPASHAVKIFKSGGTAIHIAIANGLEHVVEILVLLCTKEALSIPDDHGDTPLHLAAAAGSVRMCVCITRRDSQLVGSRNGNGETPFFVAVSRGKMGAFLCLQRVCENTGHQYAAYYRRNNGDTILHSAISEEYYDIAFYIIHLYGKELAHKVNENGISALHLLASKPSSFPSGSHLIGLSKLIYNCIFVRELRGKRPNYEYLKRYLSYDDLLLLGMELRRGEVFDVRYPENLETCVRFIALLQFFICLLVCCSCQIRYRSDQQPDIENQLSDSDLGEAAGRPRTFRSRRHQSSFPPIYATFLEAIKLILRIFLAILIKMRVILGYEEMAKRIQEKEKHIWSTQVLDLLLEAISVFPYEQQDGTLQRDPHIEDDITDNVQRYPPIEDDITDNDGMDLGPQKDGDRKTIETPLLIAAKNGVVEVVRGILHYYPGAISDLNTEKKNIVMLAVENRHLHLYKFLLKEPTIIKTIFHEVDEDGNSALHIAATMTVRQPWRIQGAALQMHMEVKWYKFVKHSMPPGFFVRYNHRGRTPGAIFKDTHRDITDEGRQWLIDNSQSCSVVAALIATVAFATSATIPGGVKQDSGTPTLENDPIFIISAVASLVALCFSMISVIMFLGILTSSFQLKDFHKDLPRKLLLGMISLLASIVSMLVSFFAGHHFVLKEELRHSATSVYTLACLPLVVFIMVKFPLDLEIVWTTLNAEPQQCRK